MNQLTCFTCNKIFYRRRGYRILKHVFCSKSCFVQYQKEQTGNPILQRTRIEKICPYCKKKYYVTPSQNFRKFCSRACKSSYALAITKTCVVCGSKYRSSHPKQKCCSRKCFYEKRKIGKSIPCEICGKTFYSTHDSRFCSNKCANDYQKRTKIDCICKVCGKSFKASPSRLKHTKNLYCSVPCVRADPDRLQMLKNMNSAQQITKPNKLEQVGYKLLDQLGVVYVPQHLIANKFCVDAFVPSSNLIIQFDGNYWHGNPALYPSPDKRQRRRIAIDGSQNNYFIKCGYKILRFWEHDIHKRPEWVQNTIQEAIQDHSPTQGT